MIRTPIAEVSELSWDDFMLVVGDNFLDTIREVPVDMQTGFDDLRDVDL